MDPSKTQRRSWIEKFNAELIFVLQSESPLALALPAVIGLGVYVAAESLILRARLKARLPVAVAPRRRNPQRWSPNNGLAFTGLYILQKAPHRLEQPNRDPCNKTAPTKRSYGTGGKINPASEVVFPFG